jgi:hypothetical protein
MGVCVLEPGLVGRSAARRRTVTRDAGQADRADDGEQRGCAA